MTWTKLSIATTLAAALIASPATAYADDPPPPPSPSDAPLPLPNGSQNVPPGAEVYCPGLPWIRHRCHQCVGDPAHNCWDR
jgi:hypothetical protein